MVKTELKTERIFEKLTVPYSQKEQEQLEQSILRNGCLKPIVTWNGVILDGHKRYRICELEGIEYEIIETQFLSVEDAVMWVCRQRSSGLEKNRLAYKYLVGKWYSMGIVINRRKQARLMRDTQLNDGSLEREYYRTSKQIAFETGLCHSTVELYRSISNALEAIMEKEPALFDLLLLGKYKASFDKILEMAGWGPRKLQEERRHVLKGDVQKTCVEKAAPLQRRLDIEREKMDAVPLAVGIKEMPAFDPDMEFRGLALTIPTWMNAMARAQSKTDMTLVSGMMKKQLSDILLQFRQQIDQIMEVL